MSLQKQQDFLARLYTDESLRQKFLSTPAKIGAENDLNEREITELAEIMPEELNFFAESLFWKRLRETEKFLHLTRKALGEDFAKLFREFSQNFNPQTVKKHFEDALGFSLFLQKRQIESPWISDLVKFERSKLIFNDETKKFIFAKFKHDIREIIGELSHDKMPVQKNFRRKTTFAVWLRLGKKTKYYCL